MNRFFSLLLVLYPFSYYLQVINASLHRHIILWMIGFDGAWERDFMFELFPMSKFIHVYYKDLDKIKNETIYEPQIIAYNVGNAGVDGKYQIVRDYIDRYHPLILIHMADEFQGIRFFWQYSAGTQLYPLVRVFEY